MNRWEGHALKSLIAAAKKRLHHNVLADRACQQARAHRPERSCSLLRTAGQYMGSDPDPEPSLKIPGIIISLIFSEQRKLVFRATPLQN